MIFEILNEYGAVVNVVTGDAETMELIFPGKWREVVDDATGVTHKPEVVITSLSVSGQGGIVHDDMKTVRVPVGETLTVTAEMHVEGELVPFDGSFNMPLISTDGRVRIKLVEFIGGKTTFSAVMDVSRIFIVTEAHINSELPIDQHMKFSGLKVYAVE